MKRNKFVGLFLLGVSGALFGICLSLMGITFKTPEVNDYLLFFSLLSLYTFNLYIVFDKTLICIDVNEDTEELDRLKFSFFRDCRKK